MTANEIFTVARRFLKDTYSPYRWDTDELAKNLQFGIRELHKMRPETRYVDGALTDGVTLTGDYDANIPIDDRFEEVLAYYVVYLCYLDDSADTVNAQLAEMYLQKFNTRAQL